ncbi:hypothetical protein MKW94_020864 [Papaver nudicaule]|uniref:SAM-dependent MTase RsmB/NOP-type domain-containing protein n=1 Tax=Papaver nudicaule TaxID=74823 RepID=A0AA41VLI0_PAPNU|nr:hypothetical protein [Papaver nudicaule]
MDYSEQYNYNPTLAWNDKVEEYFINAYGADHFSKISKALTHPSSYSCVRVNTLKATSDSVTEKLLTILQETGHVSDGALKSSVQKFPVQKCQVPGLDYVLFVNGSGPHDIQYSSALNKPVKEVIVSRKCAEAVLRGAQVFVPGVLACSAHVEIGDTVAVSVAVEQPVDGGWSVGITRGITLEGTETDPHHLQRRGLYIGQGTTLLSRAGIFRASHGVAVQMTERVYNLPSFHGVLEGEIFLQNLPSIITAHALDPQPGDRVLDMCAAPGGKTTALAILMRDAGEIVAADRSHNKVLDIKKLAAEMGLKCITAHRQDALKAVCQSNETIDYPNQHSNETKGVASDCHASPLDDMESVRSKAVDSHLACNKDVSEEMENQRNYQSKADIRKSMRRMRNGPGRNQTIGGMVEKSKGFPPNSFDRVLLDAPCSALGLRPRLFAGEETMESLKKHGKYQKKMFDQAIQLVRPGGTLVYSTCTLNPGENEAVIRYALDKYKFLSLAPQHPRIGGRGLIGGCELVDENRVEKWLTPEEAELVQRFDPSSSLDTIGFFIAKFSVGQKDI